VRSESPKNGRKLSFEIFVVRSDRRRRNCLFNVSRLPFRSLLGTLWSLLSDNRLQRILFVWRELFNSLVVPFLWWVRRLERLFMCHQWFSFLSWFLLWVNSVFTKHFFDSSKSFFSFNSLRERLFLQFLEMVFSLFLCKFFSSIKRIW
jgi:hypothetical protein